VWLLSIGVGAWIGVQLSMKVCHKKMEAGYNRVAAKIALPGSPDT
jgi:hypothetical protein